MQKIMTANNQPSVSPKGGGDLLNQIRYLKRTGR